jgi:hypothetical protein
MTYYSEEYHMFDQDLKEAEKLLSRLMFAAKTPAQVAAALELLLRFAGRGITLAAGGDTKKIDTLLEGSHHFMIEEAAYATNLVNNAIDHITRKDNGTFT